MYKYCVGMFIIYILYFAKHKHSYNLNTTIVNNCGIEMTYRWCWYGKHLAIYHTCIIMIYRHVLGGCENNIINCGVRLLPTLECNVYKCMCVCVRVYVYACVYVYTCMCVYVYTCMCVYVCTSMLTVFSTSGQMWLK